MVDHQRISIDDNYRTRISIDDMRTIVSQTSFGTARYMKDELIISEYGATPEVLVQAWELIQPKIPRACQPHHMLWWLYNCKHYPTKQVLEKALRVSAPTIRRATKPIKEAFLQIQLQVVGFQC